MIETENTMRFLYDAHADAMVPSLALTIQLVTLLFFIAQLVHSARMKRITLYSLDCFSFGASECFNACDRHFV